MSKLIEQKEEIIMKLIHYFITEENYEPMIVNGVQNEIWLENLEAPYKVIRINSNYIHNNEQFQIDNYKIKNVTKQIKRKTFTFNVKTLNILLDVGENVKINNQKNIDNYIINDYKDIRKDNNLGGLFPKLKTTTLQNNNPVETFINITTDINSKSKENNERIENIFAPKKIIMTNIIIAINIILFILTYFNIPLFNKLILNPTAVKNGEIYRLITSIFMHNGIFHLAMNMYTLYIIGKQIETFLGKYKFILIYMVSGLTGSLLSCIITYQFSLGASGAIFGLFGCLLYFGFHYRLYLGNVILKEIIPIIILNLLIGFTLTGIDNAAHIGGLIGGIFATMAQGIDNKTPKSTKINGTITLILYVLFLSYILFTL